MAIKGKHPSIHPSHLVACAAHCAQQISAKDHVRFQMMFGNILKVHMDGLRKRDRAKAKKKKKMAAD